MLNDFYIFFIILFLINNYIIMEKGGEREGHGSSILLRTKTQDEKKELETIRGSSQQYKIDYELESLHVWEQI